MKTGIVRRVDDLGRIVIPKEIRRALSITEGTPLEMSVSANTLILEKYHSDAGAAVEGLEAYINLECADQPWQAKVLETLRDVRAIIESGGE